VLALVDEQRNCTHDKGSWKERFSNESYVGYPLWGAPGNRVDCPTHLWRSWPFLHQSLSYDLGAERDNLQGVVEKADQEGEAGYPFVSDTGRDGAGQVPERTLYSTRGVDFTMFVMSFDDTGVYQFRSRPDILLTYPHANIKNAPRKVGVIDIEPCPHDEASATAFVEAIGALSHSAGSVCGFQHRYADKEPKWTLHVVVDSLALEWVLTGKGEGYDRVEVIVDRCLKQLSWFDASVEFAELSVAEVVCGKRRKR